MKTTLSHTITILFSGLLLMASLATGGELQRNQVAADAHWLIHLDAEVLKRTQLGRFILAEVIMPHLKPQAAKLKLDADKLVDQTRGITAYGGEFKNQEDPMSILVVDMAPEMTSILKGLLVQQSLASADQPNPHVKILKQRTREIFLLHDEVYSIFSANGPLLLGKNLKQIENAHARVEGSLAGLAATGTFLDYPDKASGEFIMAAAENFNSHAEMPPQAKFLQLASGARLTAGESEQKLQLKVHLKTESNDLANQVQAVVQGLIAFAMLSSPESSFSSLAHGSHVSVSDRFVHFHVSIPIEQVMEKVRKGS